MLRIRAATRKDVPRIFELIVALARFEKLAHEVVGSKEALEEHLFGPRVHAEVLVAEFEGALVGFALFFHSYSTFLTQPGIYLEDLYVEESHRGKGIGRALLVRLAQLAVERGCGRFEWSVLDWNAKAIEFYRKLGAVPNEEWTMYRVAGASLTALAAS